MISMTEATIVAKDLQNNKLQVRMPIIDGIPNSLVSPSSSSDLSWASYVYWPGVDIEYQVGDSVYVGFLNGGYDDPVVLGFMPLSAKKIESRAYITARTVEATDSLVAPLDTTIGLTSYQDLFNTVDRVHKEELEEGKEG